MKRNRRWRGWWMVAVLGLSVVGNGQWADWREPPSHQTIVLPHGPSPGGAVASGSIGLMGSRRVERPGRDEDLWPEAGADGRYRVIDACRYDEELQREHELILCQGHRVLWRVGEQLRQEALDSVRWGAVGGALGKTVRATVKSARQVIHHGHNTAKIADKPLYRYMSRAEADAIRETGLLRGGRAGETFWTDSRFTSAARAQSRLSLGSAPEVRMEFRLKNNPALERAGTRVQPANGGTGLGREYSTFDRVEVEIINVQPFTH